MKIWRALKRFDPYAQRCITGGSRSIHNDRRQRLAETWIPTLKIERRGHEPRNATALLMDAGYIRQAYAGIYHFLPLGLRVLNKVESLIDKHMQSVGASKVSLSSISSQKLWNQSGRLANSGEMFKFEDRSKSRWLLAPTHEEEITHLLVDEVNTEKNLPVRLYQISRKYRDEQRPRGGLLRGKEFIMKDLYTFDATPEAARNTYQNVRQAYANFFSELAVPFSGARADSGNMGGDLSHEYHFLHESGEDTIISCDTCDNQFNEEFVAHTERTVKGVDLHVHPPSTTTSSPVDVRDFISVDSSVLVRVILPATKVNGHPCGAADINTYAVKEAMDGFADLHTGIEEHQVMQMFQDHIRHHQPSQVVYLLDQRVTPEQLQQRIHQDAREFHGNATPRFITQSLPETTSPINLIKHQSGDQCPRCNNGKLQINKAIEIGHTFHLGKRYSSRLGLTLLPKAKGAEHPPVEMGCHGIGVSRLIAAAVACTTQTDAVRLPPIIAPYDVILCTHPDTAGSLEAAQKVYDALTSAFSDSGGCRPLDVVIDDSNKRFSQKLNEAAFIGIPIVIVLGHSLRNGAAEVRRAKADGWEEREDVKLEDLPKAVEEFFSRGSLLQDGGGTQSR